MLKLKISRIIFLICLIWCIIAFVDMILFFILTNSATHNTSIDLFLGLSHNIMGSYYGSPIFIVLILFNYYNPAFNNDPIAQLHLSMIILGYVLIGVYFDIFH
jgi:hypothetical protein